MSALATAKAIHAANAKRLLSLREQLQEAQVAYRVSGAVVERETRLEEKKKLEARLPKLVAKSLAKAAPAPTTKSTVKGVRGAHLKKAVSVCPPCGVPRKVGRPSSGECNACKRLLLGKKGGKPHTCGRVRYSRMLSI